MPTPMNQPMAMPEHHGPGVVWKVLTVLFFLIICTLTVLSIMLYIRLEELKGGENVGDDVVVEEEEDDATQVIKSFDFGSIAFDYLYGWYLSATGDGEVTDASRPSVSINLNENPFVYVSPSSGYDFDIEIRGWKNELLNKGAEQLLQEELGLFTDGQTINTETTQIDGRTIQVAHVSAEDIMWLGPTFIDLFVIRGTDYTYLVKHNYNERGDGSVAGWNLLKQTLDVK